MLKPASFVLAKAHVVVWSPCVTDKELQQELLLRDIPEHERIHVARTLRHMRSLRRLLSIRTQIFVAFNARTWPCEFRGFRIANVVNVPDLRAIIDDKKDRFDELVREFIREYDDAREQGKISHLWPAGKYAKDRFRCEARFLPLPSTPEWDAWFDSMSGMHEEYFKQRILEALEKVHAKLRNNKRQDMHKVIKDALKFVANVDLPQQFAELVRELGTISKTTSTADAISRVDAIQMRVRGLLGN